MSLVYTKNHTILNLALFALAISGAVLLFAALQPRLRANIPAYQAYKLQQFISSVQQDTPLTPREYWQFREWYSPGNFQFNHDVVGLGETQRFTKLSGPQTDFLYFTSPKLQSVDTLVQFNPELDLAAQMHVALAEFQDIKTIYEDDTTRLSRLNNGNYHLVFVRTLQDMKSANGLFDYTAQDLSVIEHTFWLNETIITP